MATIPLEDNFIDILGKAQRGLKLTDEQVAQKAGVSPADVADSKSGILNESQLKKIAPALNLAPNSLLASARKSWFPQPVEIAGLRQFNTPYEDMTVNSYLVWDPKSREAVAFDSGATCEPMLAYAQENGLQIKLILLTHTHPDHILDLTKLKAATSAPVFVSTLEPTSGAEPFEAGRPFTLGNLGIESRLTSGHSVGGITYVISGLSRPVAVVGDALFAGSMGGGGISYVNALANNRKQIFTLADPTVICPGHGPLTTVSEEKEHNPFYPEFQSR